MRPALLPCVALLCLGTSSTLAHGDLHERIAALTAQIQEHPRDVELRLARAELERQHGEWEAALKDYDEAERLDPRAAALDLGRGRVHFDAGEDALALPPLSRFLARFPQNTEALRHRALTLARLARHREAAADFDTLLRAATAPQPDDFLEAARSWRALERSDEALRVLAEGSARLGAVPALEELALAIESEAGQTDAALARIERALGRSPRREPWLERKARILLQAGRTEEARAAAREGLELIAALPEARRTTPLLQELTARLRVLAALEKGP